MNRLRLALLTFLSGLSVFAAQPAVGQPAPDFTLKSVEGKSVRFSELAAGSTTALIVLRGFPGYQCPYCQRQVREFTQQSKLFADAGVKVVFIYPGPQARATESIADKNFPASMIMLVDPDYELTSFYGLRWEANGETAYPSTFLVDPKGVVFYAKVAKLHGGRSTVAEVLDLLPKKPLH